MHPTTRPRRATAPAPATFLNPTDAALHSAVSALAMLYAAHLDALPMKESGRRALESIVRLAVEQWSPSGHSRLATRFAAHMLTPRFLDAGVGLSSVLVAIRWARDTYGLDVPELARVDLGAPFLIHDPLARSLAAAAVER
jgi:hypothetical protein